MAKTGDSNNEYKFTIQDIIKIIQENSSDFNWKKKNVLKNLTKKIQRTLKNMKDKSEEQNKEKFMRPHNGRAFLYSETEVEELLDNKEMIKYLKKLCGKNGMPPSKYELFAQQKEELNERTKEIYKLWEEVGLTREEGNFLEFDKFIGQRYLRDDELKLLKKKGLQLRDNLSNEELETLNLYERHLQSEDFIKRETERIYKEMRLDIMITALFNQHFSLDEEKLKKDIKSFVRFGEYDTLITYEEDTVQNKKIPRQTTRNSFLRLQNRKGYVKQKKHKNTQNK